MRSLKKRIAMEKLTILALLIISVHIQKTNTAEIDIISDLQFLTEEDTMVSPARTFELGFFSPVYLFRELPGLKNPSSKVLAGDTIVSSSVKNCKSEMMSISAVLVF
ncbi:hypothetical protein Tco_0797761 [Tanacetum coccineum]